MRLICYARITRQRGIATDSNRWIFFEVLVAERQVLVWSDLDIYRRVKDAGDDPVDHDDLIRVLNLIFAWVSVI